MLKKGVEEATAAYQARKAILDSLALVQQDEGTAVQQILDKYSEEDGALVQNADLHNRVTQEIAAEKAMR